MAGKTKSGSTKDTGIQSELRKLLESGYTEKMIHDALEQIEKEKEKPWHILKA